LYKNQGKSSSVTICYKSGVLAAAKLCSFYALKNALLLIAYKLQIVINLLVLPLLATMLVNIRHVVDYVDLLSIRFSLPAHNCLSDLKT